MLVRVMYFLPTVLKREWKKKEEIEKISLKMLRSLLRDVNHINPFYERKFKGLTTDIETAESLQNLPFTTKDELREAFPQELSSGYRVDDCIHESTSGSAGDVLNLYHDKMAEDYYTCIAFREYRGVKYDLRHKIAYTRFERFEKQILENFGLLRRYYVPVNYTARKQLDLLLQYKCEVISAYPSSLYEIAKVIEEDGVDFPAPHFIVSHSELLTEQTRAFIQSVFGCPVYNEYSSFEVYGIASDCIHYGMHLHIDNNIVEIIKDGEQAAPGEVGEIVVTNLMNRAMPFIRYRTGDFGALDEDMCTCGRGLPLLKKIEGRKDEYLVLSSGGKISPRIFDPLDLIFHEYVTKFQIVQKGKGRFVIKVVKRKNYTAKVRGMLIQEAKNCFPEPVDVDVVEVDDIPRTGRGKLRAVISEVSR